MATVSAPVLRTSKQVSTMAALGSLAAVLSILNMTIPFPFVPFLKFDFAEIPDVLAFLLLGPTAGLFTTAIHALFLYFVVIENLSLLRLPWLEILFSYPPLSLLFPLS